MLTIDPRTGAVAAGWSGRGTARFAALVAAAVAGCAWMASFATAQDEEPLEIHAVELAESVPAARLSPTEDAAVFTHREPTDLSLEGDRAAGVPDPTPTIGGLPAGIHLFVDGRIRTDLPISIVPPEGSVRMRLSRPYVTLVDTSLGPLPPERLPSRPFAPPPIGPRAR